MKIQKKLLSVIVLLVVCFLFSACSMEHQSTAQFLSTSSNIFVNTKSPNVCAFNVALFSDHKINQVDYVFLESPDISSEDYTVDIVNNNIDVLDTYQYQGFYIKNIMVEIRCEKPIENSSFESLILNVDGTNHTLHFSTPVTHHFVEGIVFSDKLQIMVFPNEFPSNFINDKQASAVYEFYATEDIALQDIYFDDFLSASNVMYAIGNEPPREAEFPIHVKKDEKLNLYLSFTSESDYDLSYVSTNIYFDYLAESSNERYFNSGVVTFDPIYPILDNDTSHIDKIIDSLK